MTILGYAHDLACTNDPCSCERVLTVVELRAHATLDLRNGYTEIAANEAEQIRISDGPASVLIPPGPGRSLSRGMRP